MSCSFEELLLEEMIEEDDDILFDDFSFIDSFIDDEDKVFEYENEEEEDIDDE